MHTTTHLLSTEHVSDAYALAELYEATLVIDNPTHTTTASEFVAATAPQTATWYVPDSMKAGLEEALAALGVGGLVWENVDEQADYVAATAHLFPDIQISSFTITRNPNHPSILAPSTLASSTLFIPPNQAFGSGEHATTSGCLLALEHLRDEPFSHALDFGAGSAILALAAAKLLGIPVVCADNEAPAVRIALENAVSNGVAPLITSFHADTPAHPDVMTKAPYPLIFANILLTPLLYLAAPLMAALAPQGHLILSGFRVDQEADILTAYAGLKVVHRYEQDGWVTLTLQRV